MHKIDTAGHVGNEFSDEIDAQTGKIPTVVGARWLNSVQRELVAVATSLGDPLEDDDDTQMLSAIDRKIATAVSQATEDLQSQIDALIPHVTKLLDGRWLHTTAYDGAYYVRPHGQSLLRADYPAAWAAIQASGQVAESHAAWLANKTLWGPGVDATHFNVKDLRDVFLRIHKGDKAGAFGPDVGGFKANQNKAHTHELSTRDSNAEDSGAPNDEFVRDYGLEANKVTSSSNGGDEAVPDHTSLIYVIRLR